MTIEAKIKINPGRDHISYGTPEILYLIIFLRGDPIIAKIINGNNKYKIRLGMSLFLKSQYLLINKAFINLVLFLRTLSPINPLIQDF